MDREKVIVRTSALGIAANVLLAAMKAAVGVYTRSIAVTLDAVNNLSDVLSSVVTIFGAKLAGRNPDRKHPMGHGRYEYLSAMVVSAIILYAGITALAESVKKILNPAAVRYSRVSLLLLAAAVIVKLVLGTYVKKTGQRIRSGALEASGKDALFDAVLSASVLAAALIFLFTGVSLEAYVGLLLSAVIIRSGIGMMRDTADDILGRRADEEKTRMIREILLEEPQVQGVYDLMLHNYGPDKDYGSVHLELPDTMTVEEVDLLTRKVEAKVLARTGVILTGVGVYSYNTSDTAAARMRNEIQEVVLKHDWALQLHGFYLDTEKRQMHFDVVMSFAIDPQEGKRMLEKELREAYPEYDVQITPDIDMTD